MNHKKDWKTLKKDEIYENPWIKVEHHDVINPSGGNGIYGVVRFKNIAVGIIPVDENGMTYLVGQYRYALDEYSWEIPEGGCPKGEDPLDAAKRELLEETGLVAAKYQVILPKFYTSNSVTDEYGIIYLATGLTQGKSNPEATENLEVKKVPLTEAIGMAKDGRINDLMSVAGLLGCGDLTFNSNGTFSL